MPLTLGPRGRSQYPNSKKSIQRPLHRPDGQTTNTYQPNLLMKKSEEHAASSLMSQAPAKLLQTPGLRETTP